MKNIVYLSPNFPTNFSSFLTSLKNSGARVLGLGDEPYQHLNPKVRKNLDEYYKVSDLHNYDELRRAIGFFTYKYGKIDRLDSHNEYWLDTEAKLRDDFNIPGLRVCDMKKARSKSGMKEVFRDLGLRVAKGNVVNSLKDAKKFTKEVGYPVIVKPDSGVGASYTYKVHSNKELEDIFASIPNAEYIMEEFITGQIYSFDGLADAYSNPVFFTSHVFSEGIMDIVNKDLNIFYYSVKEVPKKLEEFGRKCIAAFNVKERFFHFEFFYTPEGEFVPLEVNLRPPGGLSADMFNYACDINIYQKWADMIVKGNSKLDYERKYHVIYIGRKNGKSYKHDHREVLDKFNDSIILHQEMPNAFRPALGDYCYLARAEDLDYLTDMAGFIHEEN